MGTDQLQEPLETSVNNPPEPKEGESKPTGKQTEGKTIPPEEYEPERAMALIEKLRTENKELTKVAKRVTELEAAEKKREEAELTELEKAQRKLAELESTLRARDLADKKRTVAAKVGLPPALASRLEGSTDEEIEQDAKALLESLPKPSADKQAKISPVNPSGASGSETKEQQRERLFGKKPDIFDPTFIREHGGGVILPKKEE